MVLEMACRLRALVAKYGEDRSLVPERVRREQAERERDELAAQLRELQNMRETPESAARASDTAEPRSATEGPQERRSWLRRIFGP